MNNCTFISNIGRDAEVRYMADGKPVTQWSIAVTSGYGDKQVTTWVNCSLFGERGEKVAQYIKKGSRIGVTGQIQLRGYQKDGVEKSSLELRVNDFTLLGNKDAQPASESQPKTQGRPNDGGFDDLGDDIPW